MPDVAIQVDRVWKRFRKGELHDSLRELIPAVAKRLVGRSPKTTELNDREFWALKDVSFEVRQGESLGIIGPNGAGKSTMLKLLSRIIKPNRGNYRVKGRLSALIEVGAGFHPDLTGRENIHLNGTILGMSKKEIRSKEEQIIDFSGVESFIDTPVKRFSSGMMARLGFSVAAHMEPDVLLVDEVLSVGDAKFRRKCIQAIERLMHSNVTVVFISHILDQVRRLCPRTLVLDQGEVVFQGDTQEAIGVYLDRLADPEDVTGLVDEDASIRNVRFCNEKGIETREWQSGQTCIVDCDLSISQPIKDATVILNISTLSGIYIGTANSQRDGLILDGKPGKYDVRFVLESLPLASGEYSVEFRVSSTHEGTRCVWASKTPHVVVVRSDVETDAIVPFVGRWSATNQSMQAANLVINPDHQVSETINQVVDGATDAIFRNGKTQLK